MNQPNVAICWSRANDRCEESRSVARALHDWLPKVDARIVPWMSEISIPAGTLWLQELRRCIESAVVGVLCVTKDCLRSPWIHFEAGMLSRSESGRVVPYVFRVDQELVEKPLKDFQVVAASRTGTQDLVNSILTALAGKEMNATLLQEQWRDLEAVLRAIPAPTGTNLQRYVKEREPPLTNRGTTRTSADRAYDVLLYMFERESFDSISAFDLAFSRWEELLSAEAGQTTNVSARIFSYLEQMFRAKRCGRFRRLLVVDPDHLVDRHRSRRVLKAIADKEETWRVNLAAPVETRVVLSTSTDPNREAISDLQDFALFEGVDSFAIVETTLTSPSDRPVARPRAEITTESLQLAGRKARFDEFWDRSMALGRAMTVLDPVPAPGKLNEALEHIRRSLVPGHAFVVEAAYFDLRQPQAADRIQHLDDALTFTTCLTRDLDLAEGRVLLESFLNDFTNEEVCPAEACTLPVETAAQRIRASDVVGRILRDRYYRYDLAEPTPMGMRDTRKRVEEYVLAELARSPGDFVREPRRDGEESLLFRARVDKPILLGYLKDGGARLVPRCTSLIAQHYFDLFELATQRCGALKQLWLIDFNLWTEAASVAMGTELSFALFPWPAQVSVQVINFVYAPGEAAPSYVQMHP